MKNNYGYTVAEMLTVVGILVAIGSILTGILYSTLRGSNKTTITTAVTQNGNYAVSTITNSIINSTSVVSLDEVLVADCLLTTTSVKSIVLKNADGSTTTLSCVQGTSPDTENGRITANSIDLINKNQVASIYSSCSFTCTQKDSYSPPIIDFKFTISDINATTNETKASASFGSSVSLRNLTP